MTPTTTPPPATSPLCQAAITRAVQLIEDDGPLEDGQAMRQAFAAQVEGERRVHARAWLLGQRLGLPREWQRWRQLGGVVLALLAALVLASSWALAQVVLGPAREINVVAAFVSLLGLHAVTWLLWLASLALPGAWVGGGALGRLALQLTARLPLDRGPHAVQLARATGDVLRRARLGPWAFGGISHVVWTLAFLLMLAALALGFSLRAYRLTWETTILTPEFFVQFVQITGWLPQVLGFAVPDAATLLQPQAAGTAEQRAWAWWLIGCVAVYGLGLRALSALWCAAMWRRGQARLRLDLAEPGVRRLLARFDAMEPARVVDVEHAAAAPARALERAAPLTAERLLIGFELPPEADWPAWPLATDVQASRIEGTQAERAALLQALAAAPPRKLLIACHAPSSPDRGTERFVREASGLAGATALLLLGGRQPGDTTRWLDWLQRTALAPQVALHPDTVAAQSWLEAA